MTNLRFLAFAGVLIAGMLICGFALSAKVTGDGKQAIETVGIDLGPTSWKAFTDQACCKGGAPVMVSILMKTTAALSLMFMIKHLPD